MIEPDFFDFNWFSFSFEDKGILWFLLILPFLFYYEFKQLNSKKSKVIFSTSSSLPNNSFLTILPISFIALKTFGIGFIILSLARPQFADNGKLIKKEVEGIDIVIALDVSESMLAEDFKPNRLEAAKEVGIQFIKDRPQDRIGLVIYEGESFTQCPLTNDHNALIEKFKEVNTGYMEPGTAIGLGLATAVNRLKDSKSKSKVVILLSDGVNTRGSIDPNTAAELAKEFGIRVYSIGVGRDGMALFPARDPFGVMHKIQMPVTIDESSLKEIANLTEGKYFRAQNKKALKDIYNEIDKLEKTKVKINEFKLDPPEKFHSFLFLGLILLLVPILFKLTVLKSIND